MKIPLDLLYKFTLIFQIVIFTSLIWGLLFWFHRDSKTKNTGINIINLTGLMIVITNLSGAYNFKDKFLIEQILGLTILVIGFGLYIAALLSFHKKYRPAVVFSDSEIKNLNTSGPYSFSRNPLYLSYLLIYLGAPLSSNTLILILWVPIMLYIYLQAIHKEEKQILSTALREEYINYLCNVPRLVPIPYFSHLIKEIKLVRDHEITKFINTYENLTSSRINEEYLKQNTTIGFFKNGNLVAGYVIGTSKPYRTISIFSSSIYHSKLLSSKVDSNMLAEVCCFWKKYNLKFTNTLILWLSMAKNVKLTKKELFLGGTSSKGLACLYNSPKHAYLIHNEIIDSRENWIFVSDTNKSTQSALSVISFKLKKQLLNKKCQPPRQVVKKF